MAGTITTTVKSRKGLGIVRVKAHIVCDGSGDASATIIGSLFGRIVAVGYKHGTLDTGADITISDADSGVALITLTNAGTTDLWFRPTAVVTTNAGVAVTASTSANDVNRDIYVAGNVKLTVAQGGAAGAGDLFLVVEEG